MSGTAPGLEGFAGFVTGGTAVTLPAQLFVEVLPLIDDEAELRVTLYALFAIQRGRGPLRAVRRSALAAEAPLRRALEACGGIEALAPALDRACVRGTLLGCELEDGDALYFAPTAAGRRSLERVRAGALAVSGHVAPRPAVSERPPGVAAVYEREIGALTPAIAEALAEAAGRYPEGWIVDALTVAARANRRSWRYAEAVLRRWQVEGRNIDGVAQAADRGTAGADGADGGPAPDPYAGLFRRRWP